MTVPGWRTLRSGGAPPHAAAARMRAAAPVTEAAGTSPSVSYWFSLPWKGVDFSLSYVAFLVYVWVSITYEAKVGAIAAAVGLIGLLFIRTPLRLPTPLLLFAGLWIIAAAGYFVAADRTLFLEEFRNLGKLWLITLVFVNVVRSRAQVRFFIWVFLACFAFYPLRGALFNYFLYKASLRYGRIAWNYIYGNPNDLAALCLFPLGLCIGLLFTERRKSVRWAAIAGTALIVLVMFLTQSRAGLLALGLFLLLVFISRIRKIGVTLLFAGGALTLAYIFAPASVWSRLTGLSNIASSAGLQAVDEEGSAEQRFEILKVATKIARENPVTGVGIGQYTRAHAIQARSSEFDPTARGLRDPHNTYMHLLAETGLPGFLLWAGMVVACVGFAIKVQRDLKPIYPAHSEQLRFMVIAFAAFMFAALFGSYGRIAATYLHMFGLYIFADAAARELLARPITRSVRG